MAKIEIESKKVTASDGNHFVYYKTYTGNKTRVIITSKDNLNSLTTNGVSKGWLRAMAEIFTAIADDVEGK
ncbi:MAG: hypothetical protein WC389_15515 [Lutibacter sp.]|jgi:hypothetical protein